MLAGPWASGWPAQAWWLCAGAIQQYAGRDYRLSFSQHVVEVCSSRSAMWGTQTAPDQVQSSFFVATASAARLASDAWPTIAGNILAMLTLAPLFIAFGAGKTALLCIPLVGIAAAVAFLFRRSARAAQDAHWGKRPRVVRQSGCDASWSPGIRGSRQAARACAQGPGSVRGLVAECSFGLSGWASIGGRLPTAIAVAMLLVVAWIWLRDQPSVLFASLSQGLLIGSGVAVAASLARSMVEAGRSARDVDALFATVDAAADVPIRDGAAVLAPTETIELQEISYSYPTPRLAVHVRPSNRQV